MNIKLNGEKIEIDPKMNVYDLLLKLDMNPEQTGVAIAINREVIPKSTWKETILEKESEVEIIRAVQGG